MNEVTRTFIGRDIDGDGRVTVEHHKSLGEVTIRIAGKVVAAVDASDFYNAFQEVTK